MAFATPSTNYQDLDHAGTFSLDGYAIAAGGVVEQPHVSGMVAVDRLRRLPGYSVRVKGSLYRQRVQKLTAEMLANGFDLDSPLVCIHGMEEGREIAFVKHGYARAEALKAANAAGGKIQQVRVIWADTQVSNASFTLDLITSNSASGSPLGLYEQGIAYNRAASQGLSNCEMARRTLVSEGHVRNARLLARSPRCVADAMANGLLAETLALELWKKFGDGVTFKIQSALEHVGSRKSRKLLRSHFMLSPGSRHVADRAVSAVETFTRSLGEGSLAHVFAAINGRDSGDVCVKLPAALVQALAAHASSPAPAARATSGTANVEPIVATASADAEPRLYGAAATPGQHVETTYVREVEESFLSYEGASAIGIAAPSSNDELFIRDRSDVEPIPDFDVNQDCYSW